MILAAYARHLTLSATVALAMSAGSAGAQVATPEIRVTQFQQTIAEHAARDRDLAAFYRATEFAPIWTGEGEPYVSRRRALFEALSHAEDHGLPGASYDLPGLIESMRRARTGAERGELDVRISTLFLRYAVDVQTGVLKPSDVDSGIVRKVPLRDRRGYLEGITSADPAAFVASLPPQRLEYTRLMREKLRLERLIASGGFGATVQAQSLEPGDTGEAVVALRNRLMTMGYLPRRVGVTYDRDMESAVLRFQADHGLSEDGVAGTATIAEINVPVEERLKSVIVAMERERWINRDLGDRHVLVNLTDFHARIMENGKIYFKTRSVIGKNLSTHRTPEFSDVMEHMIVNPTWNVPRSIAVSEYLPAFKRNPYSNSHLKLIDARGRVVDRGSVNFAAYSKRNFPFDLKQPPSSRNALGLVKFMFPNVHNIYLHDTPAKSLFSRDVRAFSHGCIRLNEPFEFAHALLAWQSDDPEGLFRSTLNTGRETKIDLASPLPVHLIYRTAMSQPKGQMSYRRDVYGRDGRIWEALAREGVELRGVQG
ncbi:peptidoglycan binding protein, putative [Pseudooceanicola batsensis HTCC2597]|uniref:Peptidoglycan binding protein, putative n=1 Tax=Pseudooceanicola batsensis (strain ATCC BAA-863 / DSM 15984 / KCTC 12145 / HTCC2597) TaxID=252305 RepID=A3U3S0_PSEBH|nr:L,D-transpeptidase family protein [Pseudooceanicola batsensis]EAQ01159.1 peptidoglycan binding protein, putative [Pseudooceanicola batsensis HTCC2597]